MTKEINSDAKWKTVLLGGASPLFCLVLWEIAARLDWVNHIFFPAPTEIMTRLFELLSQEPDFIRDIHASLWRLFIGALLAIPTAVLLATAVCLNRYMAIFFNPLIALTYPIPKLAVFPLLLIIFGVSDASKIAIIAIGIFFLVLLSTIHGVQRLLSSEYYQIVIVYKLPLWKKVGRIIIRGALPEIINGIKIGLGYGLVMVVAGEFTISRNGIGFFMWNAWDQYRITDVYCGLFILSSLGLLLSSLLDNIKNNLKGFKLTTEHETVF